MTVKTQSVLLQSVHQYAASIQEKSDKGHFLAARVMAVALPFFILKAALHETAATLVRIPGFVIHIPIFAVHLFSSQNSLAFKYCAVFRQHLPGVPDVVRGAIRALCCFIYVVISPIAGLISPKANLSILSLGDPKAKPKIANPTEQTRPKDFGFTGILGMDALKQEMQTVLDCFKCRDLAKRYDVGLPNGILLQGPPGSGKTFFVLKLCEEMQKQLEKPVSYHLISSSEVATPYAHETSQNIAKVFSQAEQEAKKNSSISLIFIDEIDTLFPKIEGNSSRSRDSYRMEEQGELLQQLNNAGSKNILVVAATNHPERLDPALIRPGRFDRKIEIALPDRDLRLDLFRAFLANAPIEPDINYGQLADETNQHSIADVRAVCDLAKRQALGATIRARTTNPEAELIPIGHQALTRNLGAVAPHLA